MTAQVVPSADAAGGQFQLLPPDAPVRVRLNAQVAAMKRRPLLRGERHGLPGRTWADMPIRTRIVVVMLASVEDEDPRTVAVRPWEGLGADNQARFASVARELRRDLANAQSLF